MSVTFHDFELGLPLPPHDSGSRLIATGLAGRDALRPDGPVLTLLSPVDSVKGPTSGSRPPTSTLAAPAETTPWWAHLGEWHARQRLATTQD